MIEDKCDRTRLKLESGIDNCIGVGWRGFDGFNAIV